MRKGWGLVLHVWGWDLHSRALKVPEDVARSEGWGKQAVSQKPGTNSPLQNHVLPQNPKDSENSKFDPDLLGLFIKVEQ